MDVPFAEELGPVEPGCRCRYCGRAAVRLAREQLVPRSERVRRAFVAALRARLALFVPPRRTSTSAGQPRLEWRGHREYWYSARDRARATAIAELLGFPPPPPLRPIDPYAQRGAPSWVYGWLGEPNDAANPQIAWLRWGRWSLTADEVARLARRADAARHWLAARRAYLAVCEAHARAIWSLVIRGLERFDALFPRCYARHVERRILPVAAHVACAAIPLADQAAALFDVGMLPAGVPLGAIPGCRCRACRMTRERPDPVAVHAAAVVPWFVLRLADDLRCRFEHPYGCDLAMGMPLRVRRLYWERRRADGSAA
jgi:hypothetical protein